MSPPGLIVAAPASGAGKTTVTLGLLAALRRRGVTVQPFKSGPDYIDPAFHAAASGRPSFNLDAWAMGEATLGELIGRAADADFVLVEASMGLFDGVEARGECGRGSAADLAALTGWPVLLLLDVSGQAQSAGAVALGCARLRPDIAIAGAILNKVASPRHERLARSGLAEAGLPVLGALPRRADIGLPSRHLGLVQAGEHADLAEKIEALRALVEASADIDALLALGRPARLAARRDAGVRPPGQRIALARDAAFSFVYPHLLEGWRRAGAEILPFSPLADEPPDASADVCWLPGGYPELHAGAIAAAARFRNGLARFAATRPAHGECGGYMAMGEALIDADGTRHAMAGLLGLVTSFAKRRMHLGYRLARLDAPLPPYGPGARLRGHEFHYATIVAQPDAPLAAVFDASGEPTPETGSRRGMASGAFFHLIGPASADAAAPRLDRGAALSLNADDGSRR